MRLLIEGYAETVGAGGLLWSSHRQPETEAVDRLARWQRNLFTNTACDSKEQHRQDMKYGTSNMIMQLDSLRGSVESRPLWPLASTVCQAA
jgi:hypothetical protein